MITTDNIVIYCMYHNDSQIKDYNLNDIPSYIQLFNTNKFNMDGDSINYLNEHLCELVAFYYIWKNQIKSDYVGFCHYRRFFRDICFNNLEKYGVHYYGYIEKTNKDLYYDCFDEHMHDELYTYLKSLNIIDNDLLNGFFKNKIELNIPLKLSYIMNWDIFNKFCDITFGFIEYFFPDYKNKDSYIGKYGGRYLAYSFELICGIILSLLCNNITMINTNWNHQFYNKVLFSTSDDPNKIKLWSRKNARTTAEYYVLSNIDKKIFSDYEETLHIINNMSEIPNHLKYVELNINQYISCTEPKEFFLNTYIIKNIY